MIGLQYQAEIPPYLGEYDDNEEGKEAFDFYNICRPSWAYLNV